MFNNFYEVSVILKKELLEFKHTSIKFLLIMMLPFISSGLTAFQEGTGGVFSQEINVLCSFLFSGYFSTILIRDSIVREKDESTFPSLLLSKFKLTNILVGKIGLSVFLGTIFQVIQISMMYIVMFKLNSSLMEIFDFKFFILLPLISYLMGSIVLLISVIIDDNKTGDFLSMILALVVGVLIVVLFIELNIKSTTTLYILFLAGLILINIAVTYVLKKILTNSMFFIKK